MFIRTCRATNGRNSNLSKVPSPKSNGDFGFKDQIRRAAVSILSNIAEGFERGGDNEFLQFLSVAKGSCGEARAQLYVALDQAYISKAQFESLSKSANDVSQ